MCTTFNSFADLTELSYYKKSQTDICKIVAYLIGVKEENLGYFFDDCPEELKAMSKNDNAVIIRNLCILRTKLLTNYLKTENAFRFDCQSLDRMDLYKQEVKELSVRGVSVTKSNYRVNKYIVDINNLICTRIDGVSALFPDWVEWKYIRRMFIMPNGLKEDKIICESNRYNSCRALYPYGRYVNWDAKEEGNVLASDKKFLSILYAQNNDYFTDTSKVFDASDNVKSSIYGFIDDSRDVVLAVDCENSDAYRLFSTINGLDSDEVRKIKKIILFDDVHTTSAWKMLKTKLDGIVDVEYVLVERLKEDKSLVDHRMIAEISKSHYRDGIDSFIIVSSDSDYWAIINSIQDARFLVMVEQEKVGSDIRTALDNKGVFYCYLNDFNTSKSGEFENAVLDAELRKQLENIIDINAYQLLDNIYRAARISPSDAEKSSYFTKHIKTLKLVISDDGRIAIA